MSAKVDETMELIAKLSPAESDEFMDMYVRYDGSKEMRAKRKAAGRPPVNCELITWWKTTGRCVLAIKEMIAHSGERSKFRDQWADITEYLSRFDEKDRPEYIPEDLKRFVIGAGKEGRQILRGRWDEVKTFLDALLLGAKFPRIRKPRLTKEAPSQAAR
jgi:hypothetical protein